MIWCNREESIGLLDPIMSMIRVLEVISYLLFSWSSQTMPRDQQRGVNSIWLIWEDQNLSQKQMPLGLGCKKRKA